MRRFYLLLSLCFVFGRAVTAAPLAPADVPEPLKPWVGWVLHDEEERLCAALAGQPDIHRCLWPSKLGLALDERGGSFDLRVQVDAAGWLRLPGDPQRWPTDVSLDGRAALLAGRDGMPTLWLTPGNHAIAGRFGWERLPESLGIPRDAGLIALTVNGRAQSTPLYNAQGELWLRGAQRQDTQAANNTLDLRVYRKIADGNPLQLATRLDLTVAGEAREVLLSGALLPEFIPLSLRSALPARLETDGALRVQLRPGRWQIELVARHPGEVANLKRQDTAVEPWPGEEIWSYEAHAETRVTEIEGAQQIDPRQTELPDEWKALPAYRLQAGQVLAIKTLRRGDPEPEPDNLTLTRDLWLDFDGAGYTYRDRIAGTMSRDWRLEAQSTQQLGRVEIDGSDQLITLLEDRAGVEIRRGQLNLTAEGRTNRSGAGLPSSGWRRDFQSLSMTLHLPPGWRLLTATGVDQAPGSWVGRWTLLDLFLVLIAGLVVARLYGWPQAALALAALTLLWHENDAPRLVWLHLLAAAALLKSLPAGRAAKAVRYYRQLAALGLALIALPFMAEQIRIGLYPQLEPHIWADYEESADRSAPAMATEPAGIAAQKAEDYSAERASGARNYLPQSLPTPAPRRLDEFDPEAKTQTGPGLPNWRWNRVALAWNGPVLADQTTALYLLPPGLNLLLSLARVGLLLALAWLLLRSDWESAPPRAVSPPPTGASLPPAAALLVLLALPYAPESRADFPPATLLQELKSRLLAPPECLPDCAQIPRLTLRFDASELQMRLELHAQEALAVPLPAREGQWLPERAELDGRPAGGLFRGTEGELWIKLDPGRHELLLSGPLPQHGQTALTLPLVPRRVAVEGEGWRVDGLGENGVPAGPLQISRTLPGDAGHAEQELEARPLPPYLRVVRTLRFGLDWRLLTQVQRASPPGTPVLADIPLLEGESVTTPGFKVKNGTVAINLAAGQSETAWESILEPRASLTLHAASNTLWSEIWRAEVGSIWHLSSDGIPVTRHRGPNGDWLPEWRPWPGETLTLKLLKPRGAPGATLTLERSRLELNPGVRATDATLTLSLRSSQGGQHGIVLPEGAELRSAALDGVAHPLRLQNGALSLPIHPGQQTVTLSWRENRGMAGLFDGSRVDLGLAGVNSEIRYTPGQDRWVLLAGGPRLGPAVLFWGVLILIGVLAAGLGRIGWTPLSTRQWFLLLIGLSQIGPLGALSVVGWLYALAWRERRNSIYSDSGFNLMQAGLALLTLLALSSLFLAVQNGLLGLPDMQIAGNQSDAWHLNWYQDHSETVMPRPWVVSAPLWSYRLLMLLWAMWLAFALLDWLRWGWNCY
ncbi:hypothetical protein [Methylococcus sp. EFPC2]|uniref:hypothetical protein n=1 Tax=Methylococcus sp. EFPC2 TaxID=2812648 RepID=UPI0019676320|nr:hypothetical protein [Methylococcus sp. EFPC2]QSA96713.1 hypothetical protein JWZ97_16105 [Methylococcus sp. EFPC2]